jgi:hypothetical protein
MRKKQNEELLRAFDEMSDADREMILRTAKRCASRTCKRPDLRLVSGGDPAFSAAKLFRFGR